MSDKTTTSYDSKENPQASPSSNESCPKCGSQFLYWCNIEIDGTQARQVVDCHNCEATWVDVYLWDHREYAD